MENGPSPSTQSSLKKLITRHRTLVTFAGALIVFLTYIVNDNFRERYRNLADSIDSAENAYIVRTEFRTLNTEFIELRDRTEGIMERMDDRENHVKPGTHYKGATEDDLRTVGNTMEREDLNQEQLRFDTLSRLAEKLPKDTKEATDLDFLKQDLGHAFDQVNDWDQFIVEQDLGHKEKAAALKTKVQEDDSIMHKTGIERGMLPVNLDKLNQQILKRAHQERLTDERRSICLKKVSIALYCLGWTLGLVGKLFGADGIVGEA
jgi:hypothetical protein